MILMVPLMIETFARKLEEVRAAGLPAEPVRKKMFGERLHTICSGGAYLNPDYVDLFAEFGITILQGLWHDGVFSGHKHKSKLGYP